MTDCRLDLIPDKAAIVQASEGAKLLQFRWVYENMTRIMEWSKCVGGEHDALAALVSGLLAEIELLKDTPPGSIVPVRTVTLTAPYETTEHSEVVIDADIGAGQFIIVCWGPCLDTDENGPELGAVTFSAVAAAGSLTIKVASEEFFGGPIKVNYFSAA